MADSAMSSARQPPAVRAAASGRRRSTTGAAQEKRKAWGRKWGAVGAEYKRKRLERER